MVYAKTIVRQLITIIRRAIISLVQVDGFDGVK